MGADRLRELPSVDKIVRDPRCRELPHDAVVAEARRRLDALREAIRAGSEHEIPDVAGDVAQAVRALLGGRLRPVWNATGVVLHTNLGRAPWSQAAIDAVARTAGGYCNLELDLATGERGGRAAGVVELLRELTGCEAALVVNNCAAAVLLALTALAAGREVVTSRGELVEIGGSFRVPDVVSACGARLVDVGTTNKTRISDYEAAIRAETSVLLRVHSSNFRVVGFTEAAPRASLVALARARGLLVVEDVGSGSLDGLYDEPSVREAVRDGVDVVLFSADKLLGGPQAGIAVGRADAIRKLARHPMYRALRVDKAILAALEATLAGQVRGVASEVERMLALSSEELGRRADLLAAALRDAGVPVARRRSETFVGGGSLPGQSLPAEVVAVIGPRANPLADRLRRGEPAIVTRVHDDAVTLDPRTLPISAYAAIASAVARAVASLADGG
jgi:L-seryl-tRNA(Ser) seleniumtransferase